MIKQRCLLCNRDSVFVYLEFNSDVEALSSFGVASQKQRILRCRNCGLLFSDRVYDKTDKTVYYSKQYHEKMNGAFDADYSPGAKLQCRQRVKLVKRFYARGKILDLGCSTGCFLKYCKKGGFNIFGLEPSGAAVNICRTKLSVGKNRIEKSTIEGSKILTENTYEMISAWDVIEHLTSIDNNFSKIIKALKKDGILILRTPDSNSIFFKIANFLKGINSSFCIYVINSLFHADHFIFFNKKSLVFLSKKYNLKIIKILPDPLLWRRFKESELNRGFLINAAVSIVYFLGRLFGRGHGIILIARKS